MKHFYILFFTLLLISCVTLRYDFSREINGNDKLRFFSDVSADSLIRNSGILEGIYTEKDKSYFFILSYDIYAGFYKIKFTDVLNRNNIVFEARLESDEPYYDYLSDSFFSPKIGFILKRIKYGFEVIPKDCSLFLTRDDYKVTIDKSKNYQKYKNNLIIKKENSVYKVRYFYSKSNKIERMEFDNIGNDFILTIQ